MPFLNLLPTNKRNEACFRAFVDRDYLRCAELGQVIIAQKCVADILQVFIISLNRIGRSDVADNYRACLGLMNNQWDAELLRITFGTQHPKNILPNAKNDLQRCQLYYYAGALLLTLGEREGAASALFVALDIGKSLSKCRERDFAESDHATLIHGLSFNRLPPDRRFLNWTAQMSALRAENRLPEAVHLGTCCVDLFRGAQHTNLVISLNNLGSCYKELSNFTEAEVCFCEAITTNRLLGSGERVAGLPANLGSLYLDLGRFEEAEPLLKEAVDEARNTNVHDPNRLVDYSSNPLGTSLNNLARLYHAKGRFDAAEPVLEEAITQFRIGGKLQRSALANALNNLGMLYRDSAARSAAIPLYQEALAIRTELYGTSHPQVADSFNNLALVTEELGDLDGAEKLFTRVLEIRRATQGEDHRDYIDSLSNSALLCQSKHDFRSSQAILTECLERTAKSAGTDTLDYALRLHNLAACFSFQGDSDRAFELCHRAAEPRRRLLGSDHPLYASSLSFLAHFYVARGNPAAALTTLLEMEAIQDRMLGRIFAIGSDQRRMEFLKDLRETFYSFLSLTYRYLSTSTEALEAAYRLVLRRKNIGAEALITQREATLSGRYPQLAAQIHGLSACREELVYRELNPLATETSEAHRDAVRKLRERCSQLEAELARQLPEMNLEERLRGITISEIWKAIPADVTLIEFVRLRSSRSQLLSHAVRLSGALPAIAHSSLAATLPAFSGWTSGKRSRSRRPFQHSPAALGRITYFAI